MRSMNSLLFASVAAFSVMPSGRAADTPSPTPAYLFEAKIYQVLTNITGAGLTSQTLRGMNGWLQIIHEKLDDTELAMEGASLTWNGNPEPDNPRILPLSRPSLTTLEGEQANIMVGSDLAVQYMERKKDNLFELHTSQPCTGGVFLSLTPLKCDESNRLDCSLSFTYSWIKEREKIEGVNLEVGRPILGKASGEGAVQIQLGEWSCYQIPVESDGWIFLFLKARKVTEDDRATTSAAEPGKETPPEEEVNGQPAEETSNGPRIQVNGSTRIRVNSFSGGRK